MNPTKTRVSAGPEELRLARAKAVRNNSSLEQELFLLRGGKLADWYACAASSPVEHPDQIRERNRARVTALCPPGLTDDERGEWIRAAVAELEA